MFDRVEVHEGYTLSDYAHRAYLGPAVRGLEATARALAPRLRGRKVWMLSSTAHGGGVAEMLPRIVSLLRQSGLEVEWLVIRARDPRFFPFTKRLHNMIHGAGPADLPAEERAVYASESAAIAEALVPVIAPRDMVMIHDPQPLAVGALLKARLGVQALWRCHIGRDGENEVSRAAWEFLRPWVSAYDRAIFSLPEYVPAALESCAGIVHPAIDPLSHKNRDLRIPKLTGILMDAALAGSSRPGVAPAFSCAALRLQEGGSYAPAIQPADFGLLFRPVILQVSRWDRLKGFLPLLRGFERLKTQAPTEPRQTRHQRMVELSGLMLAGPDPEGVSDDPEAQAVLSEIAEAWQGLPKAVRDDVAVIKLPMGSTKENALMVNALQRCAAVVVQNSLEEGFGLTATEAMWKLLPVVATHASGLRAQIRDGIEGRLVANAEDPQAIADALDWMLGHEKASEELGANAHNRVFERFLVFEQVRRYLEELAALAEAE
ncbi:MAG: glycosyltransferase [Candidatus Sericytochromatia bacterium]